MKSVNPNSIPLMGVSIPKIFRSVFTSFLLIIGLFRGLVTNKIIAPLAYPLVMLFAIAGHYLCLQNGVDLQLATYAPVLLGAVVITLLEYKFPHRSAWAPNKLDVVNDITYMAVVQVLLPILFGFFLAILLLQAFQERELTLDGMWPHGLPVVVQGVLMMLVAEFLRYWMHRLAHEWVLLWRFHAVHHSPHKLYWANVGRFHPLEKVLQYLFDMLPFIVLGVSENVLGIYFVFYAINGFFQHCNIEIRLGFLNYIVSGPELHRWHHSKLIDESNKNYGNNLIIWDLLFGTWYLPKNRLVGDLGLNNRDYPMSFSRQLITPFVKGLDKSL